MKKKISNFKKKILLSAVAVFILTLVLTEPLFFGFCKDIGVWGDGTKYCRDTEILSENISQLFGFVSLFLIILTLITYRLPDQVFKAWWNFARWWVPVIVVVTILLNSAGSGGGYIGMDSMFDGFVYSILYGVLIVTSLVKIYRAYRKG